MLDSLFVFNGHFSFVVQLSLQFSHLTLKTHVAHLPFWHHTVATFHLLHFFTQFVLRWSRVEAAGSTASVKFTWALRGASWILALHTVLHVRPQHWTHNTPSLRNVGQLGRLSLLSFFCEHWRQQCYSVFCLKHYALTSLDTSFCQFYRWVPAITK